MASSGRTLSLASGVLPEFGAPLVIDAAATAGFEAAGLMIREDWTEAVTVECERMIRSTGIEILDVEVIWILPGPPNPFHDRLLEIGARLGARNVLVVSRDPDRQGTADKFARLCARGQELGLRVALEFGLFTDVKTIGDALAIVEQAASPAAALLVDPLHLARSGGAPADVSAVPRELLPYAQFCDAEADGPGASDPQGILREALDGRLQTGEGGLPLAELLHAFPPTIPLSIELRSKRLRDEHPDPVDRARVTLGATRRFLSRAEATDRAQDAEAANNA